MTQLRAEILTELLLEVVPSYGYYLVNSVIPYEDMSKYHLSRLHAQCYLHSMEEYTTYELFERLHNVIW